MTIKRRSSSKSPRNAGTHRVPTPEIHVAPRILSAEEKRELILAHAAARHPVDPVQRLSMWAGIAVCLIFVVVAWFSTVGAGIRKSLAGPMDPNLKQAIAEGTGFVGDASDPAGELGSKLKEVTEKLQAAQAQEAIKDQLLDRILSTTTAETATTTRPDLFRPAAPAPTSTGTTITTSTTP